jgi:signal transduction histidine kinase
MARHGVHFDTAQLQVINTSIEGAIGQSVTAYLVAVAALREQVISALMHDFRTPLGVVSMAAEPSKTQANAAPPNLFQPSDRLLDHLKLVFCGC